MNIGMAGFLEDPSSYNSCLALPDLGTLGLSCGVWVLWSHIGVVSIRYRACS